MLEQHRITDPLYERRLFLVTGDDAELLKWLRGIYADEDWSRLSKGRYFRHAGAHYMVVTEHGTPEQRISYLAHEVLHCTISVLADAGLTLSDASEEAYTYWFDTVLLRCLKKL